MRSKRAIFHSVRELSIWRRPASAPTVHTFVAEKSVFAFEGMAAPIVSSDAPYIGDESTRRPPASKNARRIAPRPTRAAGSVPSKVIHVPSPIAGRRSPLEWIGRRVGSLSPDAARGSAAALHAAARN